MLPSSWYPFEDGTFLDRDALCYPAPCTYGLHLFLRDATLAYKSEALQLQRQLRHLHSQFDMLTGQASALIQGRRARVAATSTINGHLTTIDDTLSAKNLQVYFEILN